MYGSMGNVEDDNTGSRCDNTKILLLFSCVPDIEAEYVRFCGKDLELRSHSDHTTDISTGLNHRSGCSSLVSYLSTKYIPLIGFASKVTLNQSVIAFSQSSVMYHCSLLPDR